jgi:hypothetical protein
VRKLRPDVLSATALGLIQVELLLASVMVFDYGMGVVVDQQPSDAQQAPPHGKAPQPSRTGWSGPAATCSSVCGCCS